MLRLVSSVVLVLLVCEGEAQLRQDQVQPCYLVAGTKAKNLKVLETKKVEGTNNMTKSVEIEVKFPADSKPYDRPIKFIYILDHTCLWSGVSLKNFAEITSGGVGERHVSIKFNLLEESPYELLVSINA